MEINKWLEILKETKKTTRGTANIVEHYSVRIRSNPENKNQNMIYGFETCNCCRHNHSKDIIVEFKEDQKLTIFQVGLLYSIFIKNRKPSDYANYHKCIAGKRFIENIKFMR